MACFHRLQPGLPDRQEDSGFKNCQEFPLYIVADELSEDILFNRAGKNRTEHCEKKYIGG
jgi:hypothetical protein